jgi:hypothetical protein
MPLDKSNFNENLIRLLDLLELIRILVRSCVEGVETSFEKFQKHE